mgnify:FL=1
MKKVKKKKQISVTQEDIATGKRNETQSCPAWLACRRALPYGDLSVGANDLYFDGAMTELPLPVRKWIERFDRSGAESVKPFRFTLRLSWMP